MVEILQANLIFFCPFCHLSPLPMNSLLAIAKKATQTAVYTAKTRDNILITRIKLYLGVTVPGADGLPSNKSS